MTAPYSQAKIKNQRSALVFQLMNNTVGGTNVFKMNFPLGFTPDIVEVGSIAAGPTATVSATTPFALWTDLIVSSDGILCPIVLGSFSGARMQFPVNPSKINGGTATFSPESISIANHLGTLTPITSVTVNYANFVFMVSLNFIEYDKTP